MKKRILLTLCMLVFGLSAFAGEQEEALQFFNRFVSAGNNYSPELLEMYSDRAKIIREVVKPNSELVDVSFPVSSYKSQMKINSKIAKIRNYKNYYSNVSVSKVSNGYKISAYRKPSLSEYKLKCYVVVQKQPGGKWVIVEEMMQTKEQIFLRYAK